MTPPMENLEGFPIPPDTLEERHGLAYLFAYFDESGKYKQQPIVSFSGFVEGFEGWRKFTDRWVQLLRHYELSRFHAVQALRYSHPFGKLPKCSTAEERATQIAPFIREIVSCLALGVAISVDVKAYEKVKPLHALYGPDPHYFAFFMAINVILTAWQIPKKYTVSLVCHDEQAKAMRCYQLLKRLKRNIPEIADRITGICFSDDRDSPQLQAADLFAYLARLEAQRIFANRPYPYESLFNMLGTVLPDGRHVCMYGKFFNEDALREVAKDRMREVRVVFKKRARIPE